MKQYLASILVIATCLGILSCAKQSSPMGGPKDEAPPELVTLDPKNETTNISPSEISLTFNEFVKLENPNKQIIITPKINVDEVEFLATRNRVNIKLNQELEENTTYVFNFQKSIQDITESNPIENLKLVFSTGDEIDSLKVSGKIAYIFPPKEKEIKDVLVGLYEDADTTDLFTAPPYYIAQTDTAGNFEITNIKAGRYRVYAWYDDNNSLKAEYKTEPYGFLEEPLDVYEDVDNIHINLFKGDLSELKINRTGTTGTNFDIILSKPPLEYEIIHEDINEKMYYRLSDKNLRLYHTSLREDSTEVNLRIRDSVGFSIDTTLYAKFMESDRKKEELEISTNSGKSFLKTIRSEWKLNKPLKSLNYDSLLIKYDTAGIIQIKPENVYLTDSLKRTKFIIEIEIPDSLKFETYKVYVGDSTIQDIEEVYNKDKIEANYKKLKEDRLADGLSGKINTEENPIILQLLNKNGEILQEKYITEGNSFIFDRIEASEYRLRAIIDRNKNRRWDTGNYYEKRQPEPVYFFYDSENKSQEIMLRGGWTLTDLLIDTRRDTGIYGKPKEDQPIDDEIKLEWPEITEKDLAALNP
ncbi:Ig-like domain-containing domain [Pleomorphovibrio marinus]|uniref:Ig-like domain-containing domain n=1 Tax=Pleomorphovibrio marinus TaxID=2164132 RepID=UPI000E0BFAB3|nr:Ig-like domain-containing domain [Pleomorphovibrio marinus]